MPRLMGWLSELIGKGINGAPTTPSNSWISVLRPPKTAAMDAEDLESALGFIQDFMLCHALVVVVVGVLVGKISSGIGTSSTVSSPSSRSKLGHSFFIGKVVWLIQGIWVMMRAEVWEGEEEEEKRVLCWIGSWKLGGRKRKKKRKQVPTGVWAPSVTWSAMCVSCLHAFRNTLLLFYFLLYTIKFKGVQ